MATFHGSCHCGKVQFDVEGTLDKLATCNCSICGRTGAIMIFVPATQLTSSGDEHLVDYQFGKRSIHHAFCGTCGTRPFARGDGHDGAAWAMVNVRCLDDVDAHTLDIQQRYDGKSL